MNFPTTNWHLLAVATLDGDTAGRASLERLCADYYQPVLAFLRVRGFCAEEAADFTQDFFVQLFESQAWRRADRGRGRFRSFLLGMLMHVIARGRARESAEKRGGEQSPASLDALEEAGLEIAEETSAETQVFDREWALRLMQVAMGAVANSYAEAGQSAQWEILSRFLPGAGESPTYEEAAVQLGLTPQALKSAVHRLRGQFREELRSAVARTVSAAHEVDAELAYLHSILAARSV